MIKPTKQLNNPYYFIKDHVVFNISFSKQGDEDCAQHKVTYLTDYKDLKAGDSYYDEHGDLQIADHDGTYQVQTNEIASESNTTFPCFKVVYLNDNGGRKEVVYYLQNMIKDGDTVSDELPTSPFYMNSHESEHYQTYIECFKFNFVSDILKLFHEGKTIAQIKQLLPHYCFQNVNYKLDDEWTYSTVIGYETLSDEDLNEMMIYAINEDVVNFANSKLKVNGKKLSTETLLTDGNVVDEDYAPE